MLSKLKERINAALNYINMINTAKMARFIYEAKYIFCVSTYISAFRYPTLKFALEKLPILLIFLTFISKYLNKHEIIIHIYIQKEVGYFLSLYIYPSLIEPIIFDLDKMWNS